MLLVTGADIAKASKKMNRPILTIRGLLRMAWVIMLSVSTTCIFGQDVAHDDKNYAVSVDVQLVQLPVSVLDKDGRSVNGLPKDDFEVFEDGVEQEISLFTHDDVPISVGLVIDNSASMHNKRERVNSAALSFVRESNPQDETFIVDFDDEAYLDFTNSINDLVAALGPIDTRGETAL